MAPSDDRSLLVQGARVRLVDRGRGPPVLLLHGNPDSADLWAGVIARLSPRFRLDAASGWEEGLRRLTAGAPTRALWGGDRDSYIPAAYAERFGAREVHHFAACRHRLPADAAEEVAGHLARFLRR